MDFATCVRNWQLNVACSGNNDSDEIKLNFNEKFVAKFNSIRGTLITPDPTAALTTPRPRLTPLPDNCQLLSKTVVGLDKARNLRSCDGYSNLCSNLDLGDDPNNALVWGCCEDRNSCGDLGQTFTFGDNGEIIANPNIDSTPRSDDSDWLLAANLAGSCGENGMSCCDPEMNSLLESRPAPFEDFDIFEAIWNYINDVAKGGSTSVQEQISEASERQLLCKGNMVPYFKLNDGTDTVGFNEYDLTKKSYVGKRDCSQLQSSGDTGKAEACQENPKRDILKSELLSKDGCTCINEDETYEADPRIASVAVVPKYSSEEVYLQICGRSNPDCISCLRDGNFFQPFNGICQTSEEDAREALEGEIKQRLSSSNVDRIFARMSDKKETGVIGIADGICGIIIDDGSEHLCKQCIASAQFWNIAGCTSKALKMENAERLCQNLSGTEGLFCTTCVQSGQHWTAVGCISPQIGPLIEQWLFGFAMGLAGMVTLGCIIYSAFLMQTSMGDPEKVSKAQELMTSCIVGLVVIIFSVFILRVIGVDILRIPGLTDSSISSLPGTGTLLPTPTLTPAISSPGGSTPTPPIPTPTTSLADYTCGSSPAPNEVYLYDNNDYGGTCLRLTVGTYGDLSSSDIKNADMYKDDNILMRNKRCADNFNDCINSMKVGDSVRVTVFNEANFNVAGKNTVYERTSHVTTLDIVGYADSISSIKVEAR